MDIANVTLILTLNAKVTQSTVKVKININS